MPKSPRISPRGFSLRPARRIEVLGYPSVQLLDVSGPLQVFVTTNEIVQKSGAEPPYSVHVVTAQGGTVTASCGLGVDSEPLLSNRRPDTLIIAGGPGVHAASGDAELRAMVCQRARDVRRLASVCTGTFLLAAAGLLDGRRVTTHWGFCAELAKRFPSITVEPDPIFVRDGQIWTSAGVTAGIDLALALVEEDLGRTIALAVARYLVVFLKRPGGQAQFSTALTLQASSDQFGALHEWITENLGGDLSLAALAIQIGMSERSFSRHYLAATGTTPARAVERLRVDAACALIAESRLSLKSISRRCGFGAEETMRRSFLRVLNVSPQDYRRRFGT